MLDVRGLSVTYDAVQAVRNVSVRISKGEIVCVIGSNGAGKTTIMRAICGLKEPSSGEILLRGERVDGLSTDKVIGRSISIVPETGRLFGSMTVYENLVMGAYLRNDKTDDDFVAIFEMFPILWEKRMQLTRELSGGQRQMVAIARALMGKPELLLMDEPSLGLAPIVVRKVGEIVSGLRRKGISILLAEQNARMALDVSDRGYVLETGEVILEGHSGDLAKDDEVRKAYLGL